MLVQFGNVVIYISWSIEIGWMVGLEGDFMPDRATLMFNICTLCCSDGRPPRQLKYYYLLPRRALALYFSKNCYICVTFEIPNDRVFN